MCGGFKYTRLRYDYKITRAGFPECGGSFQFCKICNSGFKLCHGIRGVGFPECGGLSL